MLSRYFRWLVISLVVAALAVGAARASAQETSTVAVLEVKGLIAPPAANYVQRGVEAAQRDGAHCVVVLLDTPGGLDSSMRKIVEALMGAEMPTIVYVSPQGARAASAGVFISAAANVLAMAPGTNIGAAHPVGMGGELEGTMADKVTNDAAAYVRAIAAARNRNPDWLEDAVRKSVSASAEEAIELGVADLMANDLHDLLVRIDGLEVTVDSETVTLRTASAPTHRIGMNFGERFLDVLADPNIAFLLLSIGGLAVMIELLHFGLIVPGVIGVICLVLGFLSLGSLPINWAGLALMGAALALFVTALMVPGFGAPEIGAVICLVLGSLFLFTGASPTLPEVRVSRWLIVALGSAAAAVGGYVFYTIAWSQRGARASGPNVLIGQTGVVKSRLAPTGTVQAVSEVWSAVSEGGEVIEAGEEVVILSVEGLTLRVRKIKQDGR